jgi:AcrR family transcriptional regulator
MSPRTRAVRLPRAERRKQLVEVARTLFVEHGYAATSMDQIAEAAAVSKPVLYQHFPGKHELFLHLLDAEVESLVELIQRTLASGQDNAERTRAAVTAVYTYVSDPSRRHRLLLSSGLTKDLDVQERCEVIEGTLARHIGALLQEGSGATEAEAELVSRGLVAYMIEAARWWADEADPDARPSFERAVEITCTMLWRGLSSL